MTSNNKLIAKISVFAFLFSALLENMAWKNVLQTGALQTGMLSLQIAKNGTVAGSAHSVRCRPPGP